MNTEGIQGRFDVGLCTNAPPVPKASKGRYAVLPGHRHGADKEEKMEEGEEAFLYLENLRSDHALAHCPVHVRAPLVT